MTEARPSAHMSGMETSQPSEVQDEPHVIERLSRAQNPDADTQDLWQLIDDTNTTVANTARRRLNLVQRPLTPVHIPVIDPATGLVIAP